VLRYDTVGRNGSFILKYTDCGHNGGLCGAVRGPTFTINTERGPVTARDNKVPAPGWHHIAGVYDGAVVKLFVDGTLVDQQAAEGALVQNDVAVTIGRIAGGLGCFEGLLDELRISRAARSDAWVKTSYANQRDPKAFCRAGAEETAP
jgi:hypothetical protein